MKNSTLNSMVDTPSAEQYWSSDQLRVMRGLEIPSWFRAGVDTAPDSETVLESLVVKAIESVAEPVAEPLIQLAQQTLVETAAAPNAATEPIVEPVVEAKAVLQTSQAASTETPCDWLVISSTPISSQGAQALVLWQNILTSMGQSLDSVAQRHILEVDTATNDPFDDAVQTAISKHLASASAMQAKIVITLGQFSSQAVLGVEDDLNDIAGELHALESFSLLALPDLAQLIQTPSLKAQVWRDLNLIV